MEGHVHTNIYTQVLTTFAYIVVSWGNAHFCVRTYPPFLTILWFACTCTFQAPTGSYSGLYGTYRYMYTPYWHTITYRCIFKRAHMYRFLHRHTRHCTHVYVYMHTQMYMYVHTHTRTHTYAHAHRCTHTHTHTHRPGNGREYQKQRYSVLGQTCSAVCWHWHTMGDCLWQSRSAPSSSSLALVSLTKLLYSTVRWPQCEQRNKERPFALWHLVPALPVAVWPCRSNSRTKHYPLAH